MEPKKMDNDHDLLIRVDTKLGTLLGEFQLMRDSTNTRLTSVEKDKLDVATFNEFKVENSKEFNRFELEINKKFLEKDQQNEKTFIELRAANAAQNVKIEKLIRYLYIGLGIVGTLQFLAPFLIKQFIH